MDFKNYFSKKILDRGYDYYRDNAVEDMESSDNVINAVVTGSDDYEVEIVLSDSKIEDMYCSCPYASDGNYCKHMAAVLYEWDEHKDDKKSDDNMDDILFKPAYTSEKRMKKHEAVEKLITEASDDVIRSFLSEILTDNERLCLRFYNIINKQNNKADLKGYFRQIDAITDQYLGRDNFINYHDADDYIIELEDIIYNDVRTMLDNENYLSAFEVLNYIFTVIGKVDIDDSGGGIGMLGDNIYQLWCEILEKVNSDDKRKMFEWFIAHTDGSVIDYLEEYVEHIIAEDFNEEEFEQRKLDFFRDMIKKTEEEKSDWKRNYDVGKWAVRYLNMLIDLNYSDEQIASECIKYCKSSDVRKFYIDICMRKKDYSKVIEILDDGIEADKESRGLVSEYSKKKKEIYLIIGDKIAYIDQLWQLVLEHAVGDMDVYNELKRQYTEDEWVKLREKVFAGLPKYTRIEKYYNEEKLYDRLLECVLKSNGLYMLEQYENVLKDMYPEQLLSKYKKELEAMSRHSADRKHYSDIAAILRRMKKIMGGKRLAVQIIDEWRVKYKNRPAMMDELNKV